MRLFLFLFVFLFCSPTLSAFSFFKKNKLQGDTIHICIGESYTVCGNIYNQTGAYQVICTGSMGQDSLVDFYLDVEEIDLDYSPKSATQTCESNIQEAELCALSNINASYEWFSDSISIGIDSCFSYQFTIALNNLYLKASNPVSGCISEIPINLSLLSNVDAPIVTLNLPTWINCGILNDTIRLEVEIISPTNYILEWKGPCVDSDSTVLLIPGTAACEGIYTCEITNPLNGCISKPKSFIMLDFEAPGVYAKASTINCYSPSTLLFANSIYPNVTYEWFGPNGFTANVPQIDTTYNLVEGEYTVIVTDTFTNCTATETVILESDFTPPDIQLIIDTILFDGCENDSVILPTFGLSYRTLWTSPCGDTLPSNVVEAPFCTGEYQVTITGISNGCTSSELITVLDSCFVSTFEAHNVDQIQINPTLSEGHYSIKNRSKQVISAVEVFNINGHKALEISNIKQDTIEIDLLSESSGLYFIRVNFGSSWIWKKVVKM